MYVNFCIVMSWNIRNVNISHRHCMVDHVPSAEEVWQLKTVFGSRYISVTNKTFSIHYVHYNTIKESNKVMTQNTSNKHDAPKKSEWVSTGSTAAGCVGPSHLCTPKEKLQQGRLCLLGTRRYSGCKEAFKRQWNQFEFIRMIDHEDPLFHSHINQLLSKLPLSQEILSCITKYLMASMHTNYMCMYVYFTTEYCI